MEVLAQSPTVILVRMADKQHVDVEPSRGVAYQLVPKLRDHVGSVVIGSSAADRIFISINILWPPSVWTSVMSPLPTGKNEI